MNFMEVGKTRRYGLAASDVDGSWSRAGKCLPPLY